MIVTSTLQSANQSLRAIAFSHSSSVSLTIVDSVWDVNLLLSGFAFKQIRLPFVRYARYQRIYAIYKSYISLAGTSLALMGLVARRVREWSPSMKIDSSGEDTRTWLVRHSKTSTQIIANGRMSFDKNIIFSNSIQCWPNKNKSLGHSLPMHFV